MSQENQFNLPDYINIPFFLYQNEELDRSALLLGGFFYSLHTAGKIIKVSNQYLSKMLKIDERRVRSNIEYLENKGYILRSGNGSKRRINWIFTPNSHIILTDEFLDHPDTNVRDTRTRTSGIPGHERPPYNKEDNKEDNKASCAHSKNDALNTQFSFEDFWKEYPSKKAKKKCLEIWKRKKLNACADVIIKKLKEQKEKDLQWQEGYIPNPSTYLNQERWDDEITIDVVKQKKIDQQSQIKKRQEEQERISKKTQEYEQNKHIQATKDALMFRKIEEKIKSEINPTISNELSKMKNVLREQTC